MDVFTDGAVFFQSLGRRFVPPASPMRFQLNEDNLQVVLSSFSINQIVETVIATELLAIPIPHHLTSAIDLSTTLLFAVIPELYYHYGYRNVSMIIKPQFGTAIDWSQKTEKTAVSAKTIVQWVIHDDPNSANRTKATPATEIAFESELDLNLNLDISVNKTKHVALQID